MAVQDSISIQLEKATDLSYSREDRLESNNKAFELLLKNQNDSLNRVNLFRVANRFFNLNDYKGYKESTKQVLVRSIDDNDSISTAKAYNYLGDFYSSSASKDSAYTFYRKAEKLYKKFGDQINLGQVYINIAVVKSYEKDYYGAEVSAIQALNTLRDTKQIDKIYEANNVLGFISFELQDYQKSIEYHTKALELARQNDSKNEYHLVSTSLNNLGSVYQAQEQFGLAKKMFQNGLNDRGLLIDKPILYAALLDNLAYSKFKLNDTKDLPELFYQSLKVRDSLNFTDAIYSNIHLSEYYLAEGDTAKSIDYAKEALRASRETKVHQDILSALKNLGKVDKNNAVAYNEEYIKLNDSLQQAERKAKEKFARIEFETDEIILKNDRLTEQNRTILYIFIVVMLIGLLLFIIKNQRTKTRELILKQAQQKANEEIYSLMLSQQSKIEEGRIFEKKRIAQELHDGILGRLFGARLNLDSLNKRIDQEAAQNRKQFLEELKIIEQDIREISHDLNREKFALNNNFVGIVNNLIDQQENISEAHLDFTFDPEIPWDKVHNNIKINLYRILQESLQNINKYANANNIIVDLKNHDNMILLTVSDDGKGFSPEKKSKGIGLQNMISRAESCGGNIHIESSPKKGTTILLTIPKVPNPQTQQDDKKN
ncbi:tetratricopeptide repeat protein [Flavobacterium sp. NST-5]|uniref:Oxygen sensor histidine kinase NreB n=1 Tax=Flavobacterium ichthyis TaxID=2698827 RepID=A0ABW9Z896_9FLAO|nr:tetratricopeptide repeat protein [Flavobacterium ichthyis]NBL64936.1 tetratricopeptide repeat protein [Flavobacterium ichthyis]